MINSPKYIYNDALLKLEEEVDRVLSSSPPLIQKYTSHLGKTKGKMIRAKALLACAMNEDSLIDKDAVYLGAAVELMHLATLVHDDVMDNADTRRGEESLQKKFGKRTAVICGDYLLCEALMMASLMENKENKVRDTIPDYMSKVCLGELRQHVNNWNFNLTVLEYLRTIQGKTAGLFEASFYGGALLMAPDVPLSVIKEYAKLGRYIGMIFQLTDDCMDYEATENQALKPVKSDYEQGVVTLPLIHALAEVPHLKEKALKGMVDEETLDRIVLSSGGIKRTRQLAKKYFDKSILILDKLSLTEEKKALLSKLLSKSYREF